jgi:hypothetical protein
LVIAMQQIGDWLKKLGMSAYAERFAEHGIYFSVPRLLTDQDLKDIGVLLGHRRKMLAAIAELSRATPTAPESTLNQSKPPHIAPKSDNMGSGSRSF